MAIITGSDALVYIGGNEMSQANNWDLNVTTNFAEARVFGSGTNWPKRHVTGKDWSGTISMYYDSADTTVQTASISGTSPVAVLLYENRSDTTSYWYGTAWVDMSETVSVDGFVEMTANLTGDGPLQRF